jgi:hypothetical protein
LSTARAPTRASSAALARFGFVQWEFPGRLGPENGRYVVRRYAGDDVSQILVISGLQAPRQRPRRARPRRASADSAPVEVTRATVVDAVPLGDLDTADAWLERAVGDDADRVTGEALALLNRAVAGYRVAAADPWLPDAEPSKALLCRVGYGTGEQVAEGDWESARELPPPRSRGGRALALGPHERLAALLSGRDAALACEELALRARADLDHGRGREAALQTSIALEAALAELEVWRETGTMGVRLDELHGHRDAVAAAARTALEGGVPPEALAAVETALSRLEAALRARAVGAGE